MLSCAENNVPITASNKLITNTIKDLVSKAYYKEGKALFVANCNACHKLHDTDQMFFHNLNEKWEDRKLLYEFIRNPQIVIAKNAYAKAMYEECNKTEMTAFPWMTDEQIEMILKYVKEELK